MSKKVENEAFEHLRAYVGKHLPGATLRPTMNKGRGRSTDLADAVLFHVGRTYHVEIKASSKAVGHNLRFTHQTVTNAIGNDLIVALISNVESQDPHFEFFRLSDVADRLIVEPHFLIASKNARTKVQPLDEILPLADARLDISSLLASQVMTHTRLKAAAVGSTTPPAVQTPDPSQSHAPNLDPSHKLWSPFQTDKDEDGDRYPPWLKYPNISVRSIGWRMGDGEEYSLDFRSWLDAQSDESRSRFHAKYPLPADWSGFYGEASDS